MDTLEIENIIREAAFEVRRHLSFGYLESVYQNALAYELCRRGLRAETEVPIPVMYKGVEVGDFRADILVNGSVIIELKAVEKVREVHEVQLVNYLVATGLDVGFLINYGSEDYRIIRKTREYKKPNKHTPPLPF